MDFKVMAKQKSAITIVHEKKHHIISLQKHLASHQIKIFAWDIIYMKTTMPLDSLTYTNSFFIASITTDLCKIQVTCNMKT